jgi:hypothetical protein
MYRRVKRSNNELNITIPKEREPHMYLATASTPVGSVSSPVDNRRLSMPMKTFKQKIMNSLSSVSDVSCKQHFIHS